MYGDVGKKANRTGVYVFATIAFVTLMLIIILVKPISFFHVIGSSMNPTLHENELVFCLNSKKIDYGDIIAFKHDNQNVIKRVIGKPGDLIDINKSGDVFRNGQLIDEPYVKTKALGDAEVSFPYKVPANSYFVLGDNRPDSLDSRMFAVGAVKEQDIVGKVMFK